MSDIEPAGPARRDVPASTFGTWVDHHMFSIVASLGRIFSRPIAALLTIAVMALALALPLGLWLVLGNVERFSGSVQQSREISVFLKPEISAGRASALAAELRQRPDVLEVDLKTPEQGLQALREHSGLGEAIDTLQGNPLPTLLIVVPRQDEPALVTALQALPEADQVQHDVQWRQRLDAWLKFGERIALVLAVLLGSGALLVVGNTVRLDIQARSEELGILQLLGASDGFIRRPFLYLGAWYGVAAGALAIAMLAGAGAALRQPVDELAASYGSRFSVQGFDPLTALGVIAAAALLGWCGAGVVTGHFLRQTRPTET